MLLPFDILIDFISSPIDAPTNSACCSASALLSSSILEVFVLEKILNISDSSFCLENANMLYNANEPKLSFCEYLPAARSGLFVISSHQMIPHWATAVIPIEL